MKIILFTILLTFLIPSITMANYVSKAILLSSDCDAVKTIYTRMSTCSQSHDDCIQLPEGYNCQTFSELDTEIDDLTRPLYSQSSSEPCQDQESCQAILAEKVCSPGESALISESFTTVYCSSFPIPAGYQKKTVKMIREDQDKKASYDAIQVAQIARESSLSAKIRQMDCGRRVMALLAISNGKKGLTKNQRKQILSQYAAIKGMLDAGSLDLAKDEIQAISPDGVLVTEGDKTELVQEIDSCGL